MNVFNKFKRLPTIEQRQAFLVLLGILNFNYLIYKDNNSDKWWCNDLSSSY
jgi:hypothetical protein